MSHSTLTSLRCEHELVEPPDTDAVLSCILYVMLDISLFTSFRAFIFQLNEANLSILRIVFKRSIQDSYIALLDFELELLII